MAIKDKNTRKPPVPDILDNPIVAQRPAKPAQVRAATKDVSQPRTVDAQSQRFLNGLLTTNMVEAKPEDPTATGLLSLFKDNSNQVTVPDFKLATYEDLQRKGYLTEDDIVMANTKDVKVADTRVLRVRGEEGRPDTYLTGSAMNDYLSRAHNIPRSAYEGTTIGALQHRIFSQNVNRFTIADVNFSGKTGLNADLVKRMERDPQIANYVAMAQREAAAVGIDGNMYANQLWQESRFNPNAVSPRGARGIAQMMPYQVGKFGLQSADDIVNPETSIRAGARMMAGLTSKFGDQRLALVAYNGGEGAINFVEKSLNKVNVTFQEWHGFMSARLQALGSANRGAWHVETLDYTNKVALAGPRAPEPS